MFDDPESTRERYRDYKRIVDSMVTSREKHVAEVPNCGGAPLCIGPGAIQALVVADSINPGHAVLTTLVAVGELSELRKRLEAQRQVTQSWMIRERQAQDARAQAQMECERLRGELQAYEEAADILQGIEVVDPEDRG